MKACEMKKWLSAFLKDEEGASGIEYALLAAMVALVLTTVLTDIRTAVTTIFTEIKTALTAATAPGE